MGLLPADCSCYKGGDLHYLSVCSQGFVSRIALADVAGHGELVSAAANTLRDLLRKHADEWDQSDVVRELNDSLLRDAGADYATALLLSHYSGSGEIRFTNAGHLRPFATVRNESVVASAPDTGQMLFAALGWVSWSLSPRPMTKRWLYCSATDRLTVPLGPIRPTFGPGLLRWLLWRR